MLDHMGINVSDLDRSKAFYAAALAPIGYALQAEYSAAMTGSVAVAGFGPPETAGPGASTPFWIGTGTPGDPRVHLAFRVPTRAHVRAFHEAALAAGGRDNGAPGLRPIYHANYYGAFVLDPDGHNIEAVCHAPE